MIPTQGQRWYWEFSVGRDGHSKTIVEIKNVYDSYVILEIVSIKISNLSADKIGARFDVSFYRLNTSEFEYLPGQDKP